MGYRVDRNLKEKEAKNRRLKNSSLLIVVVFIMSVISNSITPKTLLAAATENNKFEIENVSVEEPITSDDNIFELTREAEKVSENEIKVSLNIRINKENIPVVNNETTLVAVQEVADNEPVNIEKTEELTENEATNIGQNQEEVGNEAIPIEEIQESSEGEFNNIDEKSVEAENLLNNIVITESLIEGFNLVNDSIKLEEVKEEGNTDITEALINSEYTDLTMESLENKLDITIKNTSYTELKLSYSISANDSIKALDNVTLFSEALLKYKLVENEEEKTANIPNAVVLVKEVVVEKEEIIEDDIVEDTEDENKSEEVIDNVEFSADISGEEVTTFSNSVVYNNVPVTWSRTPEPDDKGNNYINIKYENDYYISTSNDSYTINDKNNISTEFNPGRVIVAPTTMYDGVVMKKGTFDYNTITNILNPTQTNNVWNSDNGNGATWTHYTGDLSYADSWRLFRGEFKIDTSLNKRYYIGILDSQGEPSLIVPINDHMVVLVDGKPIGVNYTTQNKTTISQKNFSLRFGSEIYNPEFTMAYRSYPNPCGNDQHYQQSSYTDGWHIHLDHASSDNNQGILGDITSYLNPEVDTHKVEILFGDNSGNGGASKLQVFEVNASIDVQKSAYLLTDNNSETPITENETINKGEDIYYTLQMTNTSSFAADSAVFEDDFLGIKIDSSGIYKKTNSGWSKDGVGQNSISINRSDVTNTPTNKFDLLKGIPAGATITIKDTENLKYETKYITDESFAVENTVMVTGNFLNGKIPVVKSDTSTVNVKEIVYGESITIEKKVYKINEEFNESTSIVPGDKILFKFVIKNNNNFVVSGLSLSDTLSGLYSSTEPENWGFKILKGNEYINLGNEFSIEPNSTINVVTNEWIVPEPYTPNDNKTVTMWDYKLTNTVTLSNGIWSKNASVDLEIQPPSLKIQKLIASNSLLDLKIDRTFTIMVKGNDGTQYNIEAEESIEGNKKVYTLNNLKYGVTYTISEIVPMNYELVSINGGTDSSNNTDTMKDKITLTGANNNPLVTITNKKVNDSFWTSENKVINEFKYNSNKILEFIKQIFNFKIKEE